MAYDALLSEQSEDGQVKEYVYYPGTFEPLAVIDGSGEVYYYHNDLNGLPQEVTRPNGDIVWSANYDAIGQIDQILAEEIVQPLRMQGQYYDAELDLCYNRNRYYDPRIGAFISQDPLGLAAGENVYAYAPNVWGWVDPLGLSCAATSNPFPDNDTFARVMPARYAEAFASGKGNIGGGSEVYVTAADDLSGITTKSGAQQKLSLFTDYEGKTPNLSGDALMTFKVRDVNQVGLRSPIETNPARGYGFAHGGKTAGGAREWLFNNGTANELGVYDIKITPLR